MLGFRSMPYLLVIGTTSISDQTIIASQLIRNVRVFDGEKVLEHRSVLIRGGIIVQIGMLG